MLDTLQSKSLRDHESSTALPSDLGGSVAWLHEWETLKTRGTVRLSDLATAWSNLPQSKSLHNSKLFTEKQLWFAVALNRLVQLV